MVPIHFVYAYEVSNSNTSHVSARCCEVLVLEIPQIALPSEVLVLEGSPYHRVLLVLRKGHGTRVQGEWSQNRIQVSEPLTKEGN